MTAGDSEKTALAVNSDTAGKAESTEGKPEAAPATENDENAIEDKKPESTSETADGEASLAQQKRSSSEQKTGQ